MDTVYVVIAENGAHGIWSVTSFDDHELAKNSLNDIAKQVAKDLGKGEFHGKEPKITISGTSAEVTNEETFVSIDIHETVLNSSKSKVTIEF